MNQDTQNIYEAYVTESPDQIAKIDKEIAHLQSQKAQLQQSGTPTTSSSTSTGGYSMPPEAPEKGINNDWSQFNIDPKLQQSYNNLTPAQRPVSHSAPGEHPIEPQTEPTPPVDKVKSSAASAAIDSGEITSNRGGWSQEQERINQTAPMPDNWRNASWAKRARTMGGSNPARIKALAQKEWERKEAMRKEREMATSELNPNRQTGAQYLGNQLKQMPGNISAGLQGLGSAVFGKNKIPQTTAAGDAVRDADGKLQWKDNSTGKPGLFQRPGRAIKKAFTPSKPATPAPAVAAPALKNNPRNKPINASYIAFDAVLQDKNVDHLID